jgi:hypothetical protein
MAIGDVRPQEQQEQDQPSSTIVQPPSQVGDMNQGDHMKKRVKRKKYHRHLKLKFGPPFKGIIWWIKSLVTSARE